MRTATPEPRLTRALTGVLGLLRRLEPEEDAGDRRWHGPYFVPRPREWYPSRFVLYRDELYCFIEIGWSAITLIWTVDTDLVAFDGQGGFALGYDNGPELWAEALRQIETRLRSAIANPLAYNRRVAYHLPLACRTGRIRRRLTWPEGARPSLSLRERERLVGALERGRRPRGWRRLSVTRYLGVAALAYDAAFPDLAALSPRQKYERRADHRHGGMLDLPPNDAAGFARWHASRDWLGAHPWEIVFAHPHGILLSPHRVGGSWRFFLSVDTLGLYVETARMAMALGSAGVPFELQHAQKIISALRGEDWVEVGPFHGQLSLDELAQRRPEARDLVRWDPPPRLRVRRAEGTPP